MIGRGHGKNHLKFPCKRINTECSGSVLKSILQINRRTKRHQRYFNRWRRMQWQHVAIVAMIAMRLLRRCRLKFNW